MKSKFEKGEAARSRAVVATACIVTLIACLAACGEERSMRDDDAGGQQPFLELDVAVPMRDGVVLRADVFRPRDRGRFPVLVYRTPYGKDATADSYDTHLAAVRRGYAVVLQDVRGRYASDGRFEPYRHEGRDGFDTIEWAAAQRWSSGAVGTFGLSYPGAVQWLAAIESPPHLKAMVPAMTFSSPRNFFYMNGVFDLSWLPWLYVNIAPDTRARLDLPGIQSVEEAAETWPEVAAEYLGWLPLAALPHLRDAAPYYYEWLKHPPEDKWWDWAEIRGRYDRSDAAVLNVSGWYDEAYGPEGAVTNFNGLRSARPQDARVHLLLGPWTHGVSAIMSQTAGDVDFGAAAAIDYDAEILDFFDHYLRGIDNRFAADPPVRYFVMGENRWHTAAQWPPVPARIETLYLAATADGHHLSTSPPNKDTHNSPAPNKDTPNKDTHNSPAPNEDTHSLAGNEDSQSSPGHAAFLADPTDPVVDLYDRFGPHDYRALTARADLLVFDSAPFAQKTLVAGAVNAILHASCDCRDFDLWVRLFDVAPDDTAINLMSPGNDMLRASYRDPGAGRQLLEPARSYELRLSNLLTANLFAPGHRLRVLVSASFAPHFSRNLQTGDSEATSAQTRTATITIHHDREHPSRILLPIVTRRSAE